MPEIMEWFKQEGIAEGMERGIEQGMERGIEQGMERGIEQGMERGARAKAVEDARKMREHGIEWRVVTDVTGIKPDDAGIQ